MNILKFNLKPLFCSSQNTCAKGTNFLALWHVSFHITKDLDTDYLERQRGKEYADKHYLELIGYVSSL